MNFKNPLISVITVSYNAADTIEKTILSVINQDFLDYEYIIVDGGSKDGTLEIIKKYQDKITLWVSEPDKGIYDAMNKGTKLATGEWVNFMNAGDCFFDNNVFKSVFCIDRESDVIYGDNMLCYDWGKILLVPDDLNSIKEYMPFGHQTVFMKRSLTLKYSFDCSYKIAADYNLFFKVYKDGCKFEYIDKCISLFSADDGVSANNPIATYQEYSKINGHDKNKFWRSSLFFLRLRLLIRSFVLFLMPNNFVKEMKRKNILKNRLVKKVLLNQ